MSNPLPELCLYPNGQVALGGHLLALYRALDGVFADWAAARGAVEYLFPAMLPARALEKVGYLDSFPHLATLPVTLAADEDNIARFAEGRGSPDDLRLTELSPVRDILTPAACYHFYVQLEGRELAAPLALTTRATCFRREESFTPLERLWSFSMREIVCLGARSEIEAFLAWARRSVDELVEALALPVAWEHATDPFFRPEASAKYLTQRIDPVKTEMVFDGRLSLGSLNLHRSYFGETFDIRYQGEPVYSACAAFGIERWIAAIRATFGDDRARWPALLGGGAG
jgi:hypothetical protein